MWYMILKILYSMLLSYILLVVGILDLTYYSEVAEVITHMLIPQ